MKPSKVFEVFHDYRGRLFTENLTPGKTVYDEKLVQDKGKEYREWNPHKSKVAAAIQKGVNNIFVRKGSVVLYLGCASGTTVSHISDIVGKDGFVFALDFAPRTLREMVFVSELRPNIAPLLADANAPDNYQDRVSAADIIIQDIAQKNQVDIFLKNIDKFLTKEGTALLSVKPRSIDVTKKPREIFSNVKQKLEKTLKIIDYRTLDPFEKDHAIFICKKK